MSTPKPLRHAIVVISDYVAQTGDGSGATEGNLAFGGPPPAPVPDDRRQSAGVHGGYLERLPLAAVEHGLADFAEIWHHHLGPGMPDYQAVSPGLVRRGFRLEDGRAPFHSAAMVEFVRCFGAPKILCVWGLGVSEALLDACRDSIIVYNSIDAPALRVPPETSRHFDLVLTGAPWQSDAVRDRHPDMATAIMPIGPEFASPETFFPIAGEKLFDVVYVAAAQPYKRHDILFEALARSPRPLKALCVIGYGELGEALRREAADMGLDVTFVGPPGVPHEAVNRLMNQAKVGVVCGVDDGAPAILTEYMLAGLPVVANSQLRCGLHYIGPQTGLAADPDTFEAAILQVLDHPGAYAPRRMVLDHWAWPVTIAKFERLIAFPATAFPLAPSSSLVPPAFS